jgi:hypothetical protein
MSATPVGHVLLKDSFIYYDHKKYFLADGAYRELSDWDVRVIECLERGESELGVLSHKLSETELGGSVESIAERLLAVMADPLSLLELAPPLEVAAPDVIVCRFSKRHDPRETDQLIRQLRRRFRVVQMGISDHVTVRGADDIDMEVLVEDGTFSTRFKFLQWARSFIRFHGSAVLVLTGPQDAALFADLAAKVPSVIQTDHDWPSRTGIHALRGAEALVVDPLESLRTLFYIMRFCPLDDLPRADRRNSSDLAALETYGLARATTVAYSRADQPAELSALGRVAVWDAPSLVRRTRPRTMAAAGESIAIVSDFEHAGVMEAFMSRLMTIRLEFPSIRHVKWGTDKGWKRVHIEGDAIRAHAWTDGDARDGLAGAIVLPGVLRRMGVALDLMARDIPLLFFHHDGTHALTEEIPPELMLWDATPERLRDALQALCVDEARRLELRKSRDRWTSKWHLTDQIARIVHSSRNAAERGERRPILTQPPVRSNPRPL